VSTPIDRRSIPLVSTEAWRPTGIDDLEPEAWKALQDTGNVAVVAGPGAGKTEFLAQRAAYLLQTGICLEPYRILAISFKRDAAANLGRRVAKRVPEHADRFVSMTFDAFTKGLLDRFAPALPADWRMSDGYDLRFVSPAEAGRFLNTIVPSAPTALRSEISGFAADWFMPQLIGAFDLPVTLPTDEPENAADYAVHEWWRARYHRPGRAFVDFIMINRLAELLVRSAPKISRALRLTYPFVFVDEFQDTTSAQFSFLNSVFADGPAVTAVGDSKQRIMGWAGALPKAVERFTRKFEACCYRLEWNFRSSDALVQLQHVIASRLDADATPAVSKAVSEDGHDPAVVWRFSDIDREAAFIADWIADDIAKSCRKPADFALLARQKIADFEPRFRQRLSAHGVKVRNDDAPVGKMRLQDLLKNETARLLLGLLRLADQPSGIAEIWREVSTTLARVHGALGDPVAEREVGDALTELTLSLRSWLSSHPAAETPADDTVQQVLMLAGEGALNRYVKLTSPGDDLDLVADAFAARLRAVAVESSDWTDALDRFEAKDAVVLLTAHRSKSLEYHTVFFLGLDDAQWWAHDRDPAESTSTFFVGLSRAAQRLIFTTTSEDARNGKIAEFFDLLDEAGVPELDRG
jgi:DNA helicase-2/ATP-dependent DNA helicase PcrA